MPEGFFNPGHLAQGSGPKPEALNVGKPSHSKIKNELQYEIAGGTRNCTCLISAKGFVQQTAWSFLGPLIKWWFGFWPIFAQNDLFSTKRGKTT